MPPAAKSVLATASSVAPEEAHFLRQDDDWRHGIVQTRVVNASDRSRRRFILRWDNAPNGVTLAVRQDYRDFVATGGVPVDFTPPGGSEIKVRYVQAPMIFHRTYNSSAISAVVEESLATD